MDTFLKVYTMVKKAMAPGAQTAASVLKAMRARLAAGQTATPAMKNIFNNVKKHVSSGGQLTDVLGTPGSPGVSQYVSSRAASGAKAVPKATMPAGVTMQAGSTPAQRAAAAQRQSTLQGIWNQGSAYGKMQGGRRVAR